MSKLFQDLNPSTQSMILVLQKLSSDDQPFNSNGRKGGRFQLQRLAAVQLPVEETEPNQLKPSREGFTLHKRKGQAIGGCEL